MRLITAIILLISAGLAAQAKVFQLISSRHDPVRIEPERSSGLEDVFVADGTDELTAIFTAKPGEAVRWYRFGAAGAATAEPIADGTEHDGLQWRLRIEDGDAGYVADVENRRYYMWLTDYRTTPYDISAIRITRNDCNGVTITTDGKADRMVYRSITGRAIEIDREIELCYDALEYDPDRQIYIQKSTLKTMAFIRPETDVEPPYCSTRFILKGDRFLKAWEMEESVESDVAETKAVTATICTPEPDSEDYGGSAPAEIAFKAAVTDGAVFTEWQISKDPDFEDINIRFNETEVTYVFRESGTQYVRFVCADNDGVCEYISEPLTVNISDSWIKCPNAFSPGASEGINDTWTVSCKSIIEFDCQIFDRHGRRMAHLTDPTQSWNGKHNGKNVSAGVYYYVITAKGSDGKKYKLSGDINIIGYH